MSDVLTHSEAAAYLRCDEETLERRRLAGQVAYIDDCDRVLYLKEDLVDHLRSKRTSRHGCGFNEFSEPEAAKQLGVSVDTLKRRRKDKQISYMRLGSWKGIRYGQEDLDAYKSACRIEATEPPPRYARTLERAVGSRSKRNFDALVDII